MHVHDSLTELNCHAHTHGRSRSFSLASRRWRGWRGRRGAGVRAQGDDRPGCRCCLSLTGTLIQTGRDAGTGVSNRDRPGQTGTYGKPSDNDTL